MNSITTVLNFLFPLITFPYVSRILMPAGYGEAEFALSTAQLFSLIAMLGVNTYGVRECAKVRDDDEALARTFQELFAITGVWTIVVTAAFYLIVLTVPRFYDSQAVFFVAGLLIPLTTIGFQWFMGATEQYAFMAIRNTIVKVIVIASMFMFVHAEADIVIWVAVSVLSTGLASCANLIYAVRTIKLVPWRSIVWKRHLKPIFYFFLVVASASVYTALDAVMLGYMTSDVEVGYYNVAIKIKYVFVAMIAAFSSVLIPRASYYLSRNDEQAHLEIANLAMHVTVIYTLFVFAAGSIYADTLILTLAGDAYAPSIRVLIAVMPAVAAICFTSVLSSVILTPKGKEKGLASILGAAAAIDILLNLFLIPIHHALGAAIATSVTELFVLVAELVMVHRIRSLRLYTAGCLRIVLWELLAIVIMLGARLIFGSSLLVCILSCVLGFVVLVVGLAVSKNPLMNELVPLFRKKLGQKSDTKHVSP